MKLIPGMTAVVTGGGSGIGLAVGRRLGRAGLRVALADVDQQRVEAAADDLAGEGLEALAFQVDVSSIDSMTELADGVRARLGNVHLLHLNAGVSAGASLLDASPAAWERIIGINLLGVVWGIAAFVPGMIQAGEPGVVVATSSGAGAEGTAYNQPGYATSKAGAVTVMECLHGQLRDAQSGVRAAVLFPPLTATRLAGDPTVMGMVESHLRAQGVPATVVQPDEVAALLVDGIERERFFIRAGADEDVAHFAGKLGAEFVGWNERVIRGRSEAQLGDGLPDPYLW